MTLGSVAAGLVILALLFWPLEKFRPARREQARRRADTPTGPAGLLAQLADPFR